MYTRYVARVNDSTMRVFAQLQALRDFGEILGVRQRVADRYDSPLRVDARSRGARQQSFNLCDKLVAFDTARIVVHHERAISRDRLGDAVDLRGSDLRVEREDPVVQRDVDDAPELDDDRRLAGVEITRFRQRRV